MKKEFLLEEADPELWLEQIARLRVEVWDHYGMVDMSYFPDNKCLEAVDSIAIHHIAQHEGRLMAAARYTVYPDLESSHNAGYYKEAGIQLEGPIGIPERTVVHPDFSGQGLGRAIARTHRAEALKQGVRFNISENTEVNARLLRAIGRKSLGMAPPDPRFPGIQYEWMCLEP
ncbi:MAG: hypothetical protein DHS20C12_14070 [Pseudohongiella sp.]|nr:MAG: hypothetical protein DHS20C12_14070 [Pseudohongiella sp.]